MCFFSVHIVLNKLSEYKYFYISKNITSYTLLHDSHKKREDSQGTRAILIEIFMLCWNLPSSPKLWGALQKIWLSLKGITCLQVIFVLIWMKQTLIWYNLQRDGTGNGFSSIKDTFAERLQLQISVLHQSMCMNKSSRHFSQVHMMAWQNIKKNYLKNEESCKRVFQKRVFEKNVKTTFNSKLKLT